MEATQALTDRQSRSRRVSIGRAAVIVFATMLNVLACDVFDTCEPESPTQTSSNFVPPTEPKIVLENLVNAISERHIENYLSSFVDPRFSTRNFEFIPTQDAQRQYLTVFSDWSLESEREYFVNLRGPEHHRWTFPDL